MNERILIVGFGNAGRTLGADVSSRGGTVVGYLDDAATGPEILGTLGDVNAVVEENAVDLVYFAIPSADAATVRTFINTIVSPSVHLAIVPRTYDIIVRDTVHIDDLTDVDVLDLIGRQPVRRSELASREFIEGKRVLVTGAAGSIGSRLVNQLASMNPAHILCVDWWENGTFFLEQQLGARPDVTYRIADVKNTPLLDSLFREFSPEIVFHAAAYKHVPLMQQNPLEAFNNNVWGSLNVMRRSIEHGVSNFVYVSTDKAVNPVNVMGTTKRIGELLMLAIAPESPHTKFNAVRFGNVIESNGSVMQIFRNQIASKSALTVTHPEVTRFFMTVDEAVHLIIQSTLLGKDSEIFVLDMGEPVKIMDLAKSLVRAVDPSLEIDIIGLRPGEKMYEELSYEPDTVDSTSNEKVFVVRDSGEGEGRMLLPEVESLLKSTLAYDITGEELVARLRNFGFAIQ
jgi:FlaA1/EpsC-like NDP-sugar epimerase